MLRHRSNSHAVRTKGIMRRMLGVGIGDAAEHVQLKIEQILLAGVAVAPPVADHRVCLVRFVCLPALQSAEFVGTKIDAAVDNRARREGARDLQQ